MPGHKLRVNLSQRPHILFLPSWYPVQGNELNGIFNRELACLLQEGADISLLHLHFTDHPGKTRVLHFRENADVSETIVYLNPGGGMVFRQWRYFRHFFKSVREITEKWGNIDAIHVQVAWKMGLPAMYYSWKYKIPLLVTEHYTGYLKKDGSLRGWKKWMCRWILRRANVVTAVSPGLAMAIQELGVKHVEVIPNFPDPVFLLGNVANNKSQNEFYFLHISNFDDRQKQTSWIIREFIYLKKIHPHIRLMLVVPELKLEDFFAEHPNLSSEGIVFCEPTDNKNIYRSRFENANAVVSFSKFETFGITLLESLCCGVPVIYTTCGGPENFVEPDMGIEANAEDPDSLYKAMEDMIQRGNWDSQSIATRTRNKFKSDTIRNRYMELYRSIMKK